MSFRNLLVYLFGGGWRIYSRHWSDDVDVASGEYEGRSWRIISRNGIYPLVYIEGDEDVYGDETGPAHGGITFRGPKFNLGLPRAIGYDYCHSGDFLMMRSKCGKKLGKGKMHSLGSIKRNVKETIRWLNALDEGNSKGGGR